MTTQNEETSELTAALKEFAASSRFNFLKSLQVGPLLGDDAKTLGNISSMTFEELVTSAQLDGSELHQLTPPQERLLTAVLRALSEKEGREVVRGQPSSPQDAEEVPDEESAQTTFNSVQCELDLREKISHLRAHPSLPQIKDAQVGSFWDPECARAPFEETFSIQQLLALDIAVLAKKRSMTSARMNALTRALENALNYLEGEAAPSPVEPRPAGITISERVQKPLHHRWVGHYEEISPAEMALIESMMHGCSADPAYADHIRGALHHFCASFTPSEFLKIFGGGDSTAATHRKLVAWVNSGALRSVVPLIRMTFQGPGTHIARIARLLQGGDTLHSFYGIAAVLIARGLGAQQVQFEGRTCSDVWTSNVALVPLIAKQAIALKNMHFSQALSSLCPEMDPFLHQWLSASIPPRKKGKKRQERR